VRVPPDLVVAGGVAGVLGVAAARAGSSSPGALLALVAVVSVPLAAVAVGGLKRLLLALAILDTSLNLDVNVDYHRGSAAFGAIGGVSISLTTIALLGLYGLWVADFLAKPESTARPRLRWALPGVVYLAFTALSLLWAREPLLSAFEIVLLVHGLLLFIYVATFVQTDRDVRFAVGAILLALAIQGALIVATRYTGMSFGVRGLNVRADAASEGTRIAGTVGAPNTAGSFLSSTLLVAVSAMLGSAVSMRQRLALPAAGLGAVALILTLSRGAWLAFGASLLFLLLALSARRVISGRLLLVAVVAAVAALAFGGLIKNRLTSDHGATVASRVRLAETAIAVIRDHPIGGVGSNNYTSVLPAYAELSRYSYVPHDKLLLVWAEAGIGAVLAFVAFLLLTLYRGWIAIRRLDRRLVPAAAGVTASFLALTIDMQSEPFHSRPQTQILWLMAGLVTAMWGLTVGQRTRSERLR
jgi:putative inorganic carbon (HCO3(-)) transporter